MINIQPLKPFVTLDTRLFHPLIGYKSKPNKLNPIDYAQVMAKTMEKTKKCSSLFISGFSPFSWSAKYSTPHWTVHSDSMVHCIVVLMGNFELWLLDRGFFHITATT